MMAILIKPGVYVYYDILSGEEFEIAGTADVDDERWYTVVTNRKSSKWLREQETGLWCETSTGVVNMFDVHNELMTIMRLKW